MILHAPWSFTICVLVLAGFIWAALRWQYGAQIDALNARLLLKGEAGGAGAMTVQQTKAMGVLEAFVKAHLDRAFPATRLAGLALLDAFPLLGISSVGAASFIEETKASLSYVPSMHLFERGRTFDTIQDRFCALLNEYEERTNHLFYIPRSGDRQSDPSTVPEYVAWEVVDDALLAALRPILENAAYPVIQDLIPTGWVAKLRSGRAGTVAILSA